MSLANAADLARRHLLAACRRGALDEVAQLLSMDSQGHIERMAVDSDGNTPLIFASLASGIKNTKGAEVVSLLLSYNAKKSINTANKEGYTALICAAQAGNSQAVSSLLAVDDVNVNAANKNGNSALLWACDRGHSDVVSLLLKTNGIDVNHVNKDGSSALILASQNGHEGCVKLLLRARGINANLVNKNGSSALTRAHRNGHMTIFKALLDAPTLSSNGVLIWAAKNGHENVVALLLADKKINLNATDKHGNSALMWASEKGYKGVVSQLVTAEGLNLNAVDQEGRSALSKALSRRQVEVFSVLLTAKGVKLNKSDMEKCSSLLLWASSKGHEEFVSRLLALDFVDVNATDSDGFTSLIIAAAKNHASVVRLLLEAPKIDINVANKDGYTALIAASERGNVAVVSLLLSSKALDVNAANRSGATALSKAIIKGHVAVASVLLEDRKIDTGKIDGEPLLIMTCKIGHTSLVSKLIEGKDLNVNLIDENGYTPLMWASRNGHGKVVKQLLTVKEINPNITDKKGNTAFLLACTRQHYHICALIFKVPTLDLSKVDFWSEPVVNVIKHCTRDLQVEIGDEEILMRELSSANETEQQDLARAIGQFSDDICAHFPNLVQDLLGKDGLDAALTAYVEEAYFADVMVNKFSATKGIPFSSFLPLGERGILKEYGAYHDSDKTRITRDMRHAVKRFIQANIEVADKYVELLKTVIRETQTVHSKVYKRTMQGLAVEPLYREYTQLAKQVSQTVATTQGEDNVVQVAEDIDMLYKHARAIAPRFLQYTMALGRATSALLVLDSTKKTHTGAKVLKLKNEARVLERSGLRPDYGRQWKVENVVDVVRGGLQFNRMQDIMIAFELLLACDDERKHESSLDGTQTREMLCPKDPNKASIVIVRIKDRFGKSSADGWADTVVQFYFQDDENRHICEFQLLHSRMVTVRTNQNASAAFNRYRSAHEMLSALGMTMTSNEQEVAWRMSVLSDTTEGLVTLDRGLSVGKLESLVQTLTSELRKQNELIHSQQEKIDRQEKELKEQKQEFAQFTAEAHQNFKLMFERLSELEQGTPINIDLEV
eukprot:m.79992 g.79992  ORF g.79992 m.79992 type:complete len:1068 (+) comp12735_c0_seq1:196-3399(+)